MGYELKPNNKNEDIFDMGAFSWGTLLEQFGYLFPFHSEGGKWYYTWDVDPRFKEEHNYPIIISNDRFPVTEEEAKIMARMTRNFVAIQRTLDDSHYNNDLPMFAPSWQKKLPQKIREDWIGKFEEFASWAENSGGFEVC